MRLRLFNFTFMRITTFPENDLLADILLFIVLHFKPRINMHLRLFNFQYFRLNFSDFAVANIWKKRTHYERLCARER
jgi:hypothetical protein